MTKKGKSMQNTDTNDSICCNSSTSASRNNDNGKEKVTNWETITVTINNEGNNEGGAEAGAGADTATNSKKWSSSDIGIGRGSSKSNYKETKMLNNQDENQSKIIGNNEG